MNVAAGGAAPQNILARLDTYSCRSFVKQRCQRHVATLPFGCPIRMPRYQRGWQLSNVSRSEDAKRKMGLRGKHYFALKPVSDTPKTRRNSITICSTLLLISRSRTFGSERD